MFSTILIDKDPLFLNRLTQDLLHICPQAQIRETCDNAQSALTAIRQYRPNVIFLDANMSMFDGVEMLDILRGETQGHSEAFNELSVVFMTENADFALKAFCYEALHCLLKPFQEHHLHEAVRRVEVKQRGKQKMPIVVRIPQLQIRKTTGFELLPIEDIVFIKAEGSYATIYLKNNDTRCVSQPLKSFETQLLDFDFYRIHQSYMINLNFLQEFHRDGEVILRGYAAPIPIARQHKMVLLTVLQNWFISI